MSQLSLEDLCRAFDSAPVIAKPVLPTPPARALPVMCIDDHRRAFIKLFGETARYHHRYEVFRDFVSMSAIAIENAFLKSEVLEKTYLEIAGRYQPEDVTRIAQLLGYVVMGLETEMCDFLGSVFMELELGSGNWGQFFTPYSLQSLMAQLLSPAIGETISKQGWVDLSEPCCGSAGMVIGFAQKMIEEGFNPSQQLWASCIDIDPKAADMAYIQLSLLGIPAEVITGNTLSMKFSRTRYTPVYYLNEWPAKFAFRDRVKAMKKVLSGFTA